MIENKIRKIEVLDIRVPTSKTGLGSDPFHTNPDYSTVVTIITTETGKQGLSIVFTCGLGNEWVLYGIKQLALLVDGYVVDEFIEFPGKIYKKLINHPQLRWSGDI